MARLDLQVQEAVQAVLETMVLLAFQVYQDWMGLKETQVNQVELENQVQPANQDKESKELLEKMDFKGALVCTNLLVQLFARLGEEILITCKKKYTFGEYK